MTKTLLDQNLDRYVMSTSRITGLSGWYHRSPPIEVAKRLVRAGKRVAIRDRAPSFNW